MSFGAQASGFQNPITGNQGTLVRPDIKSPNYVPGVSGWTINRDGTVEFNNGTFRGMVSAGEFDGTDFVIDADGAFFYSGTPSTPNFLTGNDTNFASSTGHWTQAGNSNISHVVSPSRGTTLGAMAIASLAAGNATVASCLASNILAQGLPCSPGDVIFCSAWFEAASVARTCEVLAHFYDAGGVSVSALSAGAFADTTTGFTRVFGTVTAPATAAFCRLEDRAVATGAAGEVHYVDDAFIGNTTVNPGNLIASVTSAIGTDPHGNAFEAGFTAYSGVTSINMNGASLAWFVSGAVKALLQANGVATIFGDGGANLPLLLSFSRVDFQNTKANQIELSPDTMSSLVTGNQQNFAAERVIGTYTIPAGDAIAGSGYTFWGAGVAGDTGTPTLTVRVRVGGLTGPILGTTTGIVCRTAAAMAFSWSGRIAFTTAGAAAIADGDCNVTEHFASGTGAIHGNAAQGVAAGDSTAALTVVVTAQWSVANAANTILTSSGSMERINHEPGYKRAGLPTRGRRASILFTRVIAG